MQQRHRVERLPNGFYRVFDYACAWAVLYTPEGECRLGPDREEYREAIWQFLCEQ